MSTITFSLLMFLKYAANVAFAPAPILKVPFFTAKLEKSPQNEKYDCKKIRTDCKIRKCDCKIRKVIE